MQQDTTELPNEYEPSNGVTKLAPSDYVNAADLLLADGKYKGDLTTFDQLNDMKMTADADLEYFTC